MYNEMQLFPSHSWPLFPLPQTGNDLTESIGDRWDHNEDNYDVILSLHNTAVPWSVFPIDIL